MTLNQPHAAFTEPYRPQFHFSPPAGWTNDPNGLVYYQGEYHLFYQHYPDAPHWSTMHWGHAVSPDMLHWEHLPIALYPDANGPIFSGSAVVDADNTSGLVPGGGLVAVFSYESQAQGIAYSLDNGRTWAKYDGNPIMPEPQPRVDFRDPKVFWHAPTGRWVMIIAAYDRVKMFTSPDLKVWTFASDFGADQGAHGGVWECPDLFPLTADGLTKWVMLVSVNPGAIAGGSGTQYFVGSFDGTAFTSDNPASTVLWLDYGKDNYAGVTFNNAPGNRRLFIGWMNNWLYANLIPTSTWRGAMTLPRTISLRAVPDQGYRLAQQPVAETTRLRDEESTWRDHTLGPDHSLQTALTDRCLEIVAQFEIGTASDFGFRFFKTETQTITVSYDVIAGEIVLDRSKTDHDGFHVEYSGIFRAPLRVLDGKIKLHIFLDWSSLEIFGNDGEAAITCQIFPASDGAPIELYADGGSARVLTMSAYKLASVWRG